MTDRVLQVGTRASLLATTQARLVADLIQSRLGRPVVPEAGPDPGSAPEEES